MAAPMRGPKFSKSERKLWKKQLKSKHTLLKHDGIDSSENPTKILCVNNAGLDNGVSVEEVEEIFGCYGDIDDIIMLPRKPYAFICYSNQEDAQVAYKNLNGVELAPSKSRQTSLTLYMLFVSKVPASLSPSSELPPGLVLLENFVTEEYGKELLWLLEMEENHFTDKELKHRLVKHFGYEFKYGINDVDADDPLPQGIPDVCNDLFDKVRQTGIVHYQPDQLTINRYLPGQGIPPHVDTPAAFEDGIMSLSLGSQVVMDFRHPNGKHLSVLLPSRSLLIMTGESRYVWSHGITPRKSDIISSDKGLTVMKRDTRTSFTFRKIIHPKERINRKLPTFLKGKTTKSPVCDLQSDMPNSERDAEELERLHVHKVYEEIADHFSGTRHSPWPRISDFLMTQPPGSLVADIGCGNGKYLGVNKQLYMLGSDRSTNLVQICKERQFEVFVGDVLSVPVKSGMLDVCLCIAVIHHLSTEERRKSAVCELLRILRPGGKALIYVWAMEQELHSVKSKYLRECKFEVRQGPENNETYNVSRDNSQSEDLANKAADSELANSSTKLDSHFEKCSCSINISKENDNGYVSETDSVVNLKRTSCEEENRHSTGNGSHFDSLTGNGSHVDSLTGNGSHVGNSSRNGSHFDSLTGSDSHVDSSTGNNSHVESSLEFDSSDCSKCKKLEVHTNRTQFKQQDLLVPWQLKSAEKVKKKTEDSISSTFHRYYHVFKNGELEKLCSEIPICKVIESYYDQGNWAVILQKTA